MLEGRNFFSGLALLHGLQESNQHPAELSQYWELLNSNNNYMAYRKLWSDGFGIPFPVPHLTMLRREENKFLKGSLLFDLFRFVGYPGLQQTSAKTKISRICIGVWPKFNSTLFATCVSVMQQNWIFRSHSSNQRFERDVIPTPSSQSEGFETTHKEEPRKEHENSTVRGSSSQKLDGGGQ